MKFPFKQSHFSWIRLPTFRKSGGRCFFSALVALLAFSSGNARASDNITNDVASILAYLEDIRNIQIARGGSMATYPMAGYGVGLGTLLTAYLSLDSVGGTTWSPDPEDSYLYLLLQSLNGSTDLPETALIPLVQAIATNRADSVAVTNIDLSTIENELGQIDYNTLVSSQNLASMAGLMLDSWVSSDDAFRVVLPDSYLETIFANHFNSVLGIQGDVASILDLLQAGVGFDSDTLSVMYGIGTSQETNNLYISELVDLSGDILAEMSRLNRETTQIRILQALEVVTNSLITQADIAEAIQDSDPSSIGTPPALDVGTNSVANVDDDLQTEIDNLDPDDYEMPEPNEYYQDASPFTDIIGSNPLPAGSHDAQSFAHDIQISDPIQVSFQGKRVIDIPKIQTNVYDLDNWTNNAFSSSSLTCYKLWQFAYGLALFFLLFREARWYYSWGHHGS